MSLWQLGVVEVSSLVRSRHVSPVEVVSAFLERAAELDSELRVWVTLDAGGALAAATALAERLSRGEPVGVLAGAAIAVKDVIDVEGLATTACSKVLAGNIARADAACVERLRRADAIILGKAHTAEFAGPDPAPTRNPWNAEHTPGGSSSGSAVAVAAGLAAASLGTQTGGSLLRPAAYTGVVGLKPTYGSISNRGVIPLAWSLDHVGIMGRSVVDVAGVFAAAVGHDPLDPSSSARARQFVMPDLEVSRRSPVIGVIRDPFFEEAEPATREATTRAIERLCAQGAILREISLSALIDEIRAGVGPLLGGETYAYHRTQWEAHRELYGPKFSARMAELSGMSVADYIIACRERPQIVARLDASLQGVDVAVTPATPGPPPKDTSQTGDASFQMPWSYAGLPTVALPIGVDDSGLPTAIQLVGHRWGDGELLANARWCESVLEFGAVPPCWKEG